MHLKKEKNQIKHKIKQVSKAHSPTLKTIKMVEDALKNMNYSEIKLAQLKKILPRKINHNTLLEVLEYLDASNKIIFGVRGITWIYNPSKKLQKAIDNGYEFTPENINKWRQFIKEHDK